MSPDHASSSAIACPRRLRDGYVYIRELAPNFPSPDLPKLFREPVSSGRASAMPEFVNRLMKPWPCAAGRRVASDRRGGANVEP